MVRTISAEAAYDDPRSLPWVRASAVRCFGELVTELGGSPKEMLDAFAIAPKTLENRRSIILLRSMVRLLEQAAEQLGCPDFGLRLAERQRAAPCFGAIEMVMRNSATLAEAFDFVVRHSGFYAPRAELELTDRHAAGGRHLRYDLRLEGMTSMRQAVELGCLQPCHTAFRLAQVRPSLLWFQHQPLIPPASYRDYFGAEVRFGMPYNGVWFADSDWDAPIADSDDDLLAIGVETVDRDPSEPLAAQVREVIERSLPSGRCTYQVVAESVGLAPRTLRRYLLTQGLVFEDMKDRVRRDIAESALRTTRLSITDISALLGYTSVSSLSRSCARWFGVTPQAVRRAGREADLAANAKSLSRRIATVSARTS